MIRLHANLSLNYLAAELSTFILNVQPVINEHQNVLNEELSFAPAVQSESFIQSRTGNRMLRFCAGPGPVEIRYQCTVDIRHRLDLTTDLFEVPPWQLPDEVLQYVLPSRYCESDILMPFARTEFGSLGAGYARAQAISHWVERHVRFRSGSSQWTTSAQDIFLRREGVCRDFAHLMIALCRALNIPARFVTGVDYGADPALGPTDFHAFVEVYVGHGWYLFDPTGICPVNGLMRIGTGSDAADTAIATIFGQVQTFPPILSIAAVDDPSQGIELPTRLGLAVSTC